MAISTGTRLGPYEIGARLGAGAMGELYQATDTDLKRQVAVKLLPEAVADDSERLARFLREAEVLAALNHPNIAAIYGLAWSGAAPALVMELVEGPTLADRIAAGAMPIDEVLRVARQIAEALEGAHRQGIIHRDLKPAKIKVRPDGTVKVLEFGLAQALGASESGPIGHDAATCEQILSLASTRVGAVLGTVPYMSPEQAQGRPLDERSDIFSFGIVLYELLSGRLPFIGGSALEIMNAVIYDQPAPLDGPAAISRLLRRSSRSAVVLASRRSSARSSPGVPPFPGGAPRNSPLVPPITPG